jgi:ADP-ribose pyrophosphatase
MKHFKKLSEETIDKNPWWTYKKDVCEDTDGESHEHYYGDGPDCVLIIPILPDGRIALISQYRYITDGAQIEFPGGALDKDETPLDTAKRELREETGCEAEEMINIGKFYPMVAGWKSVAHVFLAEVNIVAEPNPDASEQIELLYRRPDEIDEMARTNNITSGMSLAAWAIARNHFAHDS